MELLQKIDIKAASNGQKSMDKQTHLKGASNENTGKNKLFEEQLNKQIDQVKEKSDYKKVDDNQQVSASKEENKAVVDELDDDQPTISGSTISIESEPDNEISENILSDPQLDESPSFLMATLLPEEGSDLPLSNFATQVANLKQSGQAFSANQNPVQEHSIEVGSVIEKAQQHISELINKMPQKLAKQSPQSLSADVSIAKPLNVSTNLTSILPEKTNIQDMRYTKIVSEMTTTDVITQTTRLQQVPLTTSVSANLSSAQTILTGPVTELTSAFNTAPLSNTLNSSIAANIQNPNWSQQVAQQVSYMIKGGFQQAEIKLNPAHLGPMEIKLMMNDDQASINFVAQHAPVRDALDSALPRLKEMLEQQGLNLSDVDVSTQSEQQQASAESQEQGSETSQQGASNEQAETSSVEQELIANMDVNSGVSIFA